MTPLYTWQSVQPLPQLQREETHNNGPYKGHRKDIANLKFEWRVHDIFLVRLGRGQHIEERAEHREIMASDVGYFEDWT